MTDIHPTAVVAEGARLGADVRVGPFCAVGPDVTLGDRVRLESHVAVDGITEIGADTRIWPFASIGHAPQDLGYRGEPTRLEIGARCMIREHVTMNPGTVRGGGLTKVGDGGLFMVGVHVGHDCRVGDGVIMANNATLGGHVEIGDGAVLGGLCAVHQRVRIGRGAMVGGMTGVERDVIPFGSVIGDRARLAGLNLVGLKRRGAPRADIHALRAAYRAVFHGSEGALAERAAAALAAFGESPLAAEMLAFIAADSARAFCTPDGRGKGAADG
ncbi:MAG: acyl-ACP--UDP-N-acetylglucosamine O-acyltransferase [Rhodobacteraceae bacterium]|nr:MAG: acyl-ACP--UDP-N-acetylglucosamine O-acyltransferase [Paracoccaceae bacterium]